MKSKPWFQNQALADTAAALRSSGFIDALSSLL